MNSLTQGRYRHYKGKEYAVVGVARHSETLEEFVVYRQEYGTRGLWARPLQMFLENVDVNDREVPRFAYLGADPDNDVVKTGNLLADIPASLPAELTALIFRKRDLRIERIVSHGHASPPGFWYDQEQQEWVLVLQGAARLRFDGEVKPMEMKPGDFIHIPAHKRHRVEWTIPDEPTIWLAVFVTE